MAWYYVVHRLDGIIRSITPAKPRGILPAEHETGQVEIDKEPEELGSIVDTHLFLKGKLVVR